MGAQRSRARAFLCVLALSIPALAQAAPVTITGDPVAPPIQDQGSGLCMASARSDAPASDFGFLNLGNYVGSLNSFMETHKDDRVEYVVDHLLDLSNNNFGGTQASLGDFRDAITPACPSGGCNVPFTLATDSFSSRLRGYFNVTEELAGKEIHFGFYVDDAVSLSFFDRNASSYNVMIRPPQLGVPTWRLTEIVVFEQAGLYPVEILYVELAEHAALEMSYYIGSFVDFERPASEPPIVELDASGFTLFPHTVFFQTVNGTPAFPDPSACLQCDRQFANLPGNGGCGDSYYCNGAALCAPCNTDLFCGPSCSPCGMATPFCVNLNENVVCVECRQDSDCRPGYSCDPDTNTCQECVDDGDCDRGETCQNRTCVACDTSDSCAGNSCNCCPGGMECSVLDPTAPPVCVECLSNAACASGVCDLVIGRCVDSLASNERPDCCGPSCLTCPADHPFCLPNPLSTACAECRWDTDCPDGTFCKSGECRPCTENKHCGLRCASCEGDTPLCLAGQTPVSSMCVRCVSDSDCDGGTCNRATHECEGSGCAQSCPPERPYCDGSDCVECYADTQCPCGGTCDRSTGTCSDSCRTSSDCLGNEHCIRGDDGDAKQCEIGAVDVELLLYCPRQGFAICSTSVGNRSGTLPWGALGMILLAVLALLGQRRKRRKP
jgi:outer membrane exchange protein TraA